MNEIPCLIKIGIEFISDTDKANCLNWYFTNNNVSWCNSSKPEEIGYFGPKPVLEPGFLHTISISSIQITEFDILKVIHDLDVNKSTGPYGIPNAGIKTCAS